MDCETRTTGEEELMAETWIPTYTGKRFDPFAPDPDLIDIVDIAHQLAGQNRWAGSTLWDDRRHPLTIAEHSIRVAIECPDEYKLDGLLHDAAEAYLGDWSTPIKSQFPELQRVEDNLHRMIAAKFGASMVIPAVVRVIDGRMLATEHRDLMATLPAPCAAIQTPRPYTERIITGPAHEAKLAFLSLFYELTTNHGGPDNGE
jgi:uncharacterized protein